MSSKQAKHNEHLKVSPKLIELDWQIFRAREAHDLVRVHKLTEQRNYIANNWEKELTPLREQIKNALALGWIDTYEHYQAKHKELTGVYFEVVEC